MWGLVLDTFFAKASELLTESALETVKNMKNYENTLGTLKIKLKSLSAKASDVEEGLKNAELSGNKKRKREVENWLNDVHEIQTEFFQMGENLELQGLFRKFFSGDQARRIIEKIDALLEQHQNLGELLHDVVNRGEEFLNKRLVGKKFGQNLEQILEFLAGDQVSSIGIYGMGGSGKTTLAKDINNRLVGQAKQPVIWITVSQVFSIKDLQDDLARVVHLDLSDERNEDKRATRLNKALSELKSIVLILDDVWSTIDLEKLGYPLRFSGRRLIVTTRSLIVCQQMDCKKKIAMEALDTNEAWELFEETIGGGMWLADPQIQEIAKSMVKMCSGLPLGIITTAGSMKGETSIYVWRNALTKLKEFVMDDEDAEEDEVFKVLKYSFDQLDRRKGENKYGHTKLQLCFLYCCLYPEDYNIGKAELINKLILEELLDKRKSRRRQIDEGHAILKRLEDVCLLESVDSEVVKMHDLVRAMASKITYGKFLRVDGEHYLTKIFNGDENLAENLEKMSLMKNFIVEIPEGMFINYPKLSTLLFQRSELSCIPNSFLSQMHDLCILDLSETPIHELPNSLSDMESLKALILENCWNLAVVPYLGKLKALKELNLSGTVVEELPQGMGSLVKLKSLKIKVQELKMIPSGLLINYPNLECLHLPHHIQAPGEEIKFLKQMEEFEGCIKHVSDFMALVSRCEEINNIILGEYNPDFETESAGSLSRVNMHNVDLKKEEEKDVSTFGHDFDYLQFSSCQGLSKCLLNDLHRLNINPITLKTLRIRDCEGVECIMQHEQIQIPKSEESSSDVFQLFHHIELINLPDFTGLMPIGVLCAFAWPPLFSSLDSLHVYGCNKMKNLGSHMAVLQNLSRIYVKNCEEMQEIFSGGAGHIDNKTSSTLAWHGFHLPKLRTLTLDGLPKLRSIRKATMSACSPASAHHDIGFEFPSLEEITILDCNQMKQMGFPVSEMQSLGYLRVERCEEMEELIEIEDTREDVAAVTSLPSLKDLVLADLPKLKSICRATMVCNSIEWITIVGCPALKKLPLHFPVPLTPYHNSIIHFHLI